MTRVDGRGRLIPTPALSKIMLHLVAGGLGGPLLKTVHCIVKFNEPATVTVTGLPRSRCRPPLALLPSLDGWDGCDPPLSLAVSQAHNRAFEQWVEEGWLGREVY